MEEESKDLWKRQKHREGHEKRYAQGIQRGSSGRRKERGRARERDVWNGWRPFYNLTTPDWLAPLVVIAFDLSPLRADK